MEREESKLLQELRDPQLPRGMRGYQEDATRDLLQLVAIAFDRVAKERDRLRQTATDRPEGEPAEEPSAETIGQTLATAAALGDQIVGEAKQQAEAVQAEAEARAAELLAVAREEAATLKRQLTTERTKLEGELDELRREIERRREAFEGERSEILAAAQREGDEQLARARAEIVRLDTEAGELRSLIEAATSDFVAIAQAALERLDGLETAGAARPDEGGGEIAGPEPSVGGPEPRSTLETEAAPAGQ
jgi:cell division septum initiation protein DivIVA